MGFEFLRDTARRKEPGIVHVPHILASDKIPAGQCRATLVDEMADEQWKVLLMQMFS
jgi:hypothetical protein